MKRFITLLLLCFVVLFCKAQSGPGSAPVNVALIFEDSSMQDKAQLYIDSSASLSINEVMNSTFTPLEAFKFRGKIPPDMVTFSYYLKFFVSNNSEKQVSSYFYPGTYFKQVELYKIGRQPEKVKDAGDHPGYGKLTLAAGEQCQVIVSLRLLKNDFNAIRPIFINDNFIDHYKLFIRGHKTQVQIFGFVLSGVLIMLILFMITNFIISGKTEFLYNALYSLCMFILVFLNSFISRSTSLFANFYFSYFDFFLLVMGIVFYISFTRKFLNTKNNYALLDKILKYGNQFILLMLGIYTYLNFFTSTYQPQYLLENIIKFLILGIGVAFISLAFTQRDRLFNYIAAGNAMLVIFSSISLALLWLRIQSVEILRSALFYYYTGIVFELAFFLLGLTYKSRSELIHRIKEQEALNLETEKKEFESKLAVIKAQQEERNRISADMHDDLGAGMTTIRLYSELAKGKLIDQPIPEIEKISSSANELLNKMNAIIWSMNSSNDSLGNMIAYIRSYAIEYFENTGINCRISIPENLPNIEVIGEIRRNVFLVVKEALNNVLKHSKATEINITLVRNHNELSLYIHDNGTGINFDTLRQFSNGLKNMKKRMEDVNIDFSIENKHGTLITLRRKVLQF